MTGEGTESVKKERKAPEKSICKGWEMVKKGFRIPVRFSGRVYETLLGIPESFFINSCRLPMLQKGELFMFPKGRFP